jgi:hypothetical protein
MLSTSPFQGEVTVGRRRAKCDSPALGAVRDLPHVRSSRGDAP